MADSQAPAAASSSEGLVRSDYPLESRSLAKAVLSEILKDPIRQENIKKIRRLMENSGSKTAI